MSKQPYRDYKEENKRESPKRKAERNERTKLRNQMIRDGKLKVGDGKVVNHKTPLSKGGSVSKKNTNIHSKNTSDRQGGKLQSKADKAKRYK